MRCSSDPSSPAVSQAVYRSGSMLPGPSLFRTSWRSARFVHRYRCQDSFRSPFAFVARRAEQDHAGLRVAPHGVRPVW